MNEQDNEELKGRRKSQVLKTLGKLDASDLDDVAVELHKKISDTDPEPVDLELVHITELEDEVEEYNKNWGKIAGLSTGLSTVDRMLQGLVPGELTVVAGETSMGKSQLVNTIAMNVAKQGSGVLFITLENSNRQVAAKFARAHGNLDMDIMFQRTSTLNWKDIDKIIAKAIEVNAKLVVVDHLHFFSRATENVAEDLGRITKEMKKNAIDQQIPILLVSHVKMRQQEKKLEDMMNNNKLRGSSYIAQDADCVLFVARDKEADDNITFVKCTKNRDREDFSDVHKMRQLVYEDHQLKDYSEKIEIPEEFRKDH